MLHILSFHLSPVLAVKIQTKFPVTFPWGPSWLISSNSITLVHTKSTKVMTMKCILHADQKPWMGVTTMKSKPEPWIYSVIILFSTIASFNQSAITVQSTGFFQTSKSQCTLMCKMYILNMNDSCNKGQILHDVKKNLFKINQPRNDLYHIYRCIWK